MPSWDSPAVPGTSGPDSAGDDRIAEGLALLAREGGLELRVDGLCMAPLILPGQKVEIRRDRPFLPGDIVATAVGSGRVLVHRFLGLWYRGHGLAVLTRADNAAGPDGLVPLSRVLGRVVGGQCAPEASVVPLVVRFRSCVAFLTCLWSAAMRRASRALRAGAPEESAQTVTEESTSRGRRALR